MDLLFISKQVLGNIIWVYFCACFVALIAINMPMIKYKLIDTSLWGKITSYQCGPIFIVVEAQDFIGIKKGGGFLKISLSDSLFVVFGITAIDLYSSFICLLTGSLF